MRDIKSHREVHNPGEACSLCILGACLGHRFLPNAPLLCCVPGVYEGHKMDEEDHVRGGACIAAADPHVAHNRETPRALLQLPKSLRGADGELAQPSWSSPEVTAAMGNDEEGHTLLLCAARNAFRMPRRLTVGFDLLCWTWRFYGF